MDMARPSSETLGLRFGTPRYRNWTWTPELAAAALSLGPDLVSSLLCGWCHCQAGLARAAAGQREK